MLSRLRHIFTLLTDPKMPKLPRIIVLLAILYGILPFDFVPDFAPVIGWMDDLVVLWLGIRWLLKSAAGRRGGDISQPQPGVIDTTAERLR